MASFLGFSYQESAWASLWGHQGLPKRGKCAWADGALNSRLRFPLTLMLPQQGHLLLVPVAFEQVKSTLCLWCVLDKWPGEKWITARVSERQEWEAQGGLGGALKDRMDVFMPHWEAGWERVMVLEGKSNYSACGMGFTSSLNHGRLHHYESKATAFHLRPITPERRR